MSSLEQLRARCEARLAGLRLPTPFTLDGFRRALEEQRGRRIVVRPMPQLGTRAPCGLWLELASLDLIFYEPDTKSRAQQDQILSHELSHVACGHRRDLRDLTVLRELLPDLDTQLILSIIQRATARPVPIHSVLGRASYPTADEEEAEMMATLLTELADQDPEPADPATSRLLESLTHPMKRNRRR